MLLGLDLVVIADCVGLMEVESKEREVDSLYY